MLKTVLALLLLSTPVFAQGLGTKPTGPQPVQTSQPPQRPASEQALLAKLSSEIDAGLQCIAANVTVSRELQTAQARIKELEDKYEAKQ